jgi:hypothetical protein
MFMIGSASYGEPVTTGIGLSVVEMEALATRVKRAGHQLETAQKSVDRAVFGAWWAGPTANNFRTSWTEKLSPTLVQRSSDLTVIAEGLSRQIREQIAASQGSGEQQGGGQQGGGQQGGVILGPPAPVFGPPLPRRRTDGMSQQQLHQFYVDQAFTRAGIDPAKWIPAKGTAANARSIEAVYQYYADLYLSDPQTYWWAGMASMIGGSFYAGFQDLNDGKKLVDLLGKVALLPGGVPPALKPLVGLSAEALERELKFYETKLLKMQKEIFTDMATAHEAYKTGGIDAISRLYANDSYGFGPQTIEAWKLIDEGKRTGNLDLIAQGNETLLRREQFRVIEDDYKAMKGRPVTGEAVTYLMTMIGTPSIPGAKSFAEVFPVTMDVGVDVATPRSVFGVSIPNVSVGTRTTVSTPLPNGNIANFDQRWALIEADTLPVYLNLARNQPTTVIDILNVPIAKRADSFHALGQIDDVISSWDVDQSVEVTFKG